ncbi:hypothetical protein D3C80_1107960 [compost metagenome]
MLFMTEDSKAEINPVPMAALHRPCSASVSSRWVSMSVRPAFFRPYTTRYMPSENITTCHGASRSTRRVEMR